ncbi:MAG: Crp/Fnr family transcriptional regulator [Bacteroidota bacterium]
MPTANALKTYCQSITPLSEAELSLIDKYFVRKEIARRKYLLAVEQVCDFIAFVEQGAIRHLHLKDGDEISCDFSFENCFITDFSSFNSGKATNAAFQAMEHSVVWLIYKPALSELYAKVPAFQTIGRVASEEVAQKASDIARSLGSDRPAERYQKLLQTQPELFQRIPQRYIADFLGISPESLSRICKRLSRGE